MNFAIVTLFPEMFEAVTEYGVSGRAVKRGLLSVHTYNPRAYTTDQHQTVDDRPYGGGPGMVMKAQPLAEAVEDAKSKFRGSDGEAELSTKVIYLSPQGRPLDQCGVKALSQLDNIVLVAGRYEGVDERFIERYVDEEWSIGDYVLSGGELPAMVMIDAVARLIPGVLGDQHSATQDSFEYGVLDCPHYTRPEWYGDEQVPDILLSGDHARIAKWRTEQSLIRTADRRPDLLKKIQLDEAQSKLLEEYLQGLEQD